MKTSLTYGLGMAIAGTILAFVLYFLGFHSSAEKLATGQTIGMIGGLAIAIVGLTLAVKARRAETPATEPFGYGRALGVGTLTGLFSSLFGSISNVIYVTLINPGIQDLLVEGELAKLEARGMTADQTEAAEGMIRLMTGPAMQGVFGLIGGFFFSFIIALIVAAVLKRPAT